MHLAAYKHVRLFEEPLGSWDTRAKVPGIIFKGCAAGRLHHVFQLIHLARVVNEVALEVLEDVLDGCHPTVNAKAEAILRTRRRGVGLR